MDEETATPTRYQTGNRTNDQTNRSQHIASSDERLLSLATETLKPQTPVEPRPADQMVGHRVKPEDAPDRGPALRRLEPEPRKTTDGSPPEIRRE